MDHGHGLAGGGGHQVDLLVDLLQRLFQHHHGEDGGTGGDVAGSGGNGVGSGHAGARVTLGRGEGDAGSQEVIQSRRALGGKGACLFTGNQNLGQKLAQGPGQVPIGHQIVELCHHGGIVIAGFAVNGEHTGGLAHADGVDAGEHKVDIACQGCDVGNLRHMGLPVQHGLIQVGDGPALGNIEPEGLRQLRGGLGGDGILPGTEGHQQLPVLVKSQVAVHHGGNAHGGNILPVLKTRHSGLQALPDLLQAVGPHAVFKAGLPGVVTGGNRHMVFVNGNGLDPGGAQLQTQHGSIGHWFIPHFLQMKFPLPGHSGSSRL